MADTADEQFMKMIAATVELPESVSVSSRLKAKVYSALMQQMAETGALSSLSQSKADGHELCVFEELVQIAPVGKKAKSLNICRVCHARVLAEYFENPPIYWSGCPYVVMKNA